MVTYIILYCTIHDDGYVVKSDCGNYNKICKCEGSDYCDFIYNGKITMTDQKIVEVDPILRVYDKFGGGFEFKQYCLYFEVNSPIYMWFANNK